jgi:TatD DNase family protein
MIELFDTHCHIHTEDYQLDADEVLASAHAAGVGRMVVVGTDLATSQAAVQFAASREGVWSSIGLHPHDASLSSQVFAALQELGRATQATSAKLVAIGECGLDYFYAHSTKSEQAAALRAQIELAIELNVPMIFHVREAFTDFWPIFDDFQKNGAKVRGVVHSFTDSAEQLEHALSRDLYIGVNGIMTFTSRPEQLDMARRIPLESLLFETDRGTINKPEMVVEIASFLANLRNEKFEDLAQATTSNARKLFNV